MITKDNIKPWEVWLANVKFEDKPDVVKARPVLFLKDCQMYLLSLKITSHMPRSNFQGEYQLIKWQEAGLAKPSTVRISKKLQLQEKDFVHRIGRLHPVDIMKIRLYLNK